MKSKLKFIIPLALLLVLGGVYKEVLAKPPPGPKPKVNGTVYVLPKEFVLDLADGHFAKLGAAIVLSPDTPPPTAAEGGATPPDGYGPLPQEAAVRAVITNVITGVSSSDLVDHRSRERLRRLVLKQIRARTDVKVTDVLFTDIAVQ